MIDEGILSLTERTGKSGHTRVYRLDMSESKLKARARRCVNKATHTHKNRDNIQNYACLESIKGPDFLKH